MTEPPQDPAGLADDPLTAGRLAEHVAHLEAGDYPYRFERSDLAADLHERFPALDPGATTGETVTVAGRVMLLRSFGKLVFATLQDVSGRIQLFVDKSSVDDDLFERFGSIDLGDWVGARGEVITTKKGELSVKVDEFTMLQKSLRPLPDKWHGLQDIELRSRQRYVDLIVNDVARDVALTRTRIIAELRRQFAVRGYLEVETPVLLIAATGALARPFDTHHHALDQDMSLRIATELYLKRLVVGGIERVFEIGRIFRNEGIDATHNPEFTMLEAYEAFADYTDFMVMLEEIVAAVATAAVGSTQITYQGRELDLEPPFRRATMLELVEEAAGEEVSFDQDLGVLRNVARRHGVEPDASWGHGKVIDALFEELVADALWAPTYVMDYPKETSPLARAHRRDENLTERFELFIAGSEYANAFSELNDPLDQRARFEAQVRAREGGDEEAHPIDEDYLLALEYGLPPTGGLGLGVDRLVMLLADQHHIRDVILFPTLRPEAGA
jgi:lysyl-tRNA synthetase class 2